MIEGIFNDPVLVEEKIDGSQISFGLIEGELMARSKGAQLVIDSPETMFENACQTIKSLQPNLHAGWIYRCEYLTKPKHNTLCYDRIPKNYMIGFDIQTGLEDYLTPEEKEIEFGLIDLECVPVLYEGKVENAEMLKELLETKSILGGTKIEGVVVKNYTLFTSEKKIAIGKYVSEAFKEVQGGEWRKANPTQGDVLQTLIDRYRTPARWLKAVQHLRDAGTLEGSPRDIPALITEIKEDTKKECEEEMKNILFAHFWSKVQRGLIAGFPEWWKEQLLESAFGDKPSG
jgi:hypothetical protein